MDTRSTSLAILTITLTVVISTVSCQIPQIALYSNTDSTGTALNLTAEYVSDLNTRGFDNVTQSLCVLGTWLLYDRASYNYEGEAFMNYIYSPRPFCTNLDPWVRNQTSSVRYAGDAVNITAESLTLYVRTYFQGQQEFNTGDNPAPTIGNQTSSLIITGRSGWTVFDQPQFRGTATCITPVNSVDTNPAFVVDVSAYPISIPRGTIRSFKKGCSSSSNKSASPLSRTMFAPRVQPNTLYRGNY